MHNPQTAQDVLQTDFNRALSARFAPVEKRQGLLQICALDAELAKIPHQTSDPLLQRIRTQFWREALFENEGSGHLLASEMMATFKANQPLFESLEDLISVHENYQDIEASTGTLWEGYGHRQAVLFKLACTYLLEGDDRMKPSFYRQCGEAYGGARLLCDNISHSVKNREEAQSIHQQANSAFESVSADLQALDQSLRFALLPLALVPPYLDLFQRSDKAQTQPIDLHPARKAWVLWRAARKGFR